MSLDKWKRSVVNIHCVRTSKSHYDLVREQQELFSLYRSGGISPEQYQAAIRLEPDNVGFTGTAIFLKHDGRRYLLTARHVVWDSIGAEHEMEEVRRKSAAHPEFPASLRQSNLEYAEEKSANLIFDKIFRVPSLDHVSAHGLNKRWRYLLNLNAGPFATQPFTLSSPESDLAIISLDQRDKKSADELEEDGLEPISLADVADGPTAEGVHVFTVGFPAVVSGLGNLQLHPAEQPHTSDFYSLPTFSFGRVAMLPKDLNYFWSDISIYPGNSGGPLIEEQSSRLVGIVHAQSSLPLESDDGEPLPLSTRIPFGKIIKAAAITDLIATQVRKDHNALGPSFQEVPEGAGG